jgi:hypothetical protein
MRGRTSGLPITGGGAGMAAPQLEQNRALPGNPVPHFWQKTAIAHSSSKKACYAQDTLPQGRRFRNSPAAETSL